LHVSKDEQESADSVPQPTVGQRKLIALARSL